MVDFSYFSDFQHEENYLFFMRSKAFYRLLINKDQEAIVVLLIDIFEKSEEGDDFVQKIVPELLIRTRAADKTTVSYPLRILKKIGLAEGHPPAVARRRHEWIFGYPQP